MMLPTQHETARLIGAIIPKNAGMLGLWHSWGEKKVLRLKLKPEPPDL
jgi:hypothetical protein